jgi:2,4'-dihydroxyacetophenone dioxygenase
MATMTAPPSDKAEIVDIKYPYKEIVERTSPGGRYIDAQTDVDSPWVPFGDNAAIKHLAFDVRRNLYSNILWVKGRA